MATIPALFMFAIHFGFKAPRLVENGSPGDFGMDYQKVSIHGQRDKNLFAWHIVNRQKPDAPTVVILHGWGVNAEVMLPLAQLFYRKGMNILMPDARNHGSSDSDGHSSMPKFAEDVESAVDWLKSQNDYDNQQIALVGHSVGAAAVILAASRRDDIAALISISSFAHPAWLMRRFLQDYHIPGFLINLVLRYIEYLIGHDYEDIAPVNTICKVKCPVLLVHGDADKTIPVSDFKAIADNCHHANIHTLLISGADHDSIDKVKQDGHKLVEFLQANGF